MEAWQGHERSRSVAAKFLHHDLTEPLFDQEFSVQFFGKAHLVCCFFTLQYLFLAEQGTCADPLAERMPRALQALKNISQLLTCNGTAIVVFFNAAAAWSALCPSP